MNLKDAERGSTSRHATDNFDHSDSKGSSYSWMVAQLDQENGSFIDGRTRNAMSCPTGKCQAPISRVLVDLNLQASKQAFDLRQTDQAFDDKHSCIGEQCRGRKNGTSMLSVVIGET